MNRVDFRLERLASSLEAVAKHTTGTFDAKKADRVVQAALRVLENKFLGCEWDPNRDRATIEKMRDAIQTIKRNQASFTAIRSLEQEVEMLLRDGVIKKIFCAEEMGSSLPRRLQAPFRYLFNLLTSKAANFVRGYIYHGWSKKIKNKELKEVIEQDYKLRYTNWFEKVKAKAQTAAQLQQAQQRLSAELGDIQRQVANHPKIQAITELEKKGRQTRKLFMDMGGERIQLQTSDGAKLDAVYLSTGEFKHVLKAQDGKKVHYTLGDGCRISGISIDSDNPVAKQKIIKKLIELGLLATDSQAGSGYALLYDRLENRYVIAGQEELERLAVQGVLKFNGDLKAYESCILLPTPIYQPLNAAEDFKQEILSQQGWLQELRIKGQKESIPTFSYASKSTPAPEGFARLKIPNLNGKGFLGGVYYIQLEKAAELVKAEVLELKQGRYSWTSPKDVSVSNADPNEWSLRPEGVAILSSGSAGVYEMHKGEVLALLMNGCDVMMLNLRGYGGSQGEPTAEGSYLDLEAAYQFIKHRRQGIPDSKIAAWTLCLSGGIGAHLAETHPQINLFLNQTYAEFGTIIRENVESEVDAFFKRFKWAENDQNILIQALKKCARAIAFQAVKLFAPDYNVKDRLAKIKGKICVMQATEDSLMTTEETRKMKAAILGKPVDCHFVDIPGEHCTPWNQVFTYQDHAKVEVQLSDYRCLNMNGRDYFIDLNDLKTRGVTQVIEGDIGYQFLLNSNNSIKVATYYQGNKLAENNFLVHPIAQHQIPAWMADKKISRKFVGHHHVRKFLSDARLGYPLIEAS